METSEDSGNQSLWPCRSRAKSDIWVKRGAECKVKSWTNEEAERLVANRKGPSLLDREGPDTALAHRQTRQHT